jgi:hypothetical protein
MSVSVLISALLQLVVLNWSDELKDSDSQAQGVHGSHYYRRVPTLENFP